MSMVTSNFFSKIFDEIMFFLSIKSLYIHKNRSEMKKNQAKDAPKSEKSNWTAKVGIS